jgi:riboflavin kinase
MPAVSRSIEIPLLLEIARRGGMSKRVMVTTIALASNLGVSQQAVSGALIRLASKGLVERAIAARGQSVRLSKAGVGLLRAEYTVYRGLFEGGATLTIRGTVSSGLGEGAYYLSKQKYVQGLERLLRATPYRGTLNLKVSDADREWLDSLRAIPGCTIPGFEEGGRTYGPIKCINARVRGLDVIIVIPSRTHYADTLELVAACKIRDELRIADGAEMEVLVDPAQN